MLGEVRVSDITEMDDNDPAFVVLDEDRLLLRVGGDTLDLARAVELHLATAPGVRFG